MTSDDVSPRSDTPASSRGPLYSGWLLYLPILALAATRELWAPDEPRYAEIAREAYEGGNLLVMHLNGALYPDKPPLLYWLAGLFGSLFHWSEFALRVPSLLSTAGSAWLCARLARRFWGAREAAWAGAFYFGTAMVVEIGGRLQIDPLLAFLCLASLVLATEAAPDERRAARNLCAAGLCLGLAALAKGPPAWVHVGFVLVVWRFLPGAARVALPRSVRGWIGFVVLAILPVGAWAAAASAAEPALFRPLFYGQHIGRVAEGTQHAGPPWYHVVHLLYLVLPWTPLFALSLRSAWRSFRAIARPRTDAHVDVGRLRAASWFLVILLVFSIIAPKRDLYLLPLYPAIALLCAREMAEAERARALAAWVGIACPAVLLLAGAALAIAPFFVNDLAPYRAPGVAIGLVLVAGGLAALAFRSRSDLAGWAQSVFGGFALAGLLFAFVLVPRINPDKSARELAHFLAHRPERPTAIACVGVQPEGYRFYAGVPTVKEALLPALERDGAQFLALVSVKHYDALPPEVRARVRVIDARSVGSREVMVLGAALTGQEHLKARAPGG